MKTHLDRHIRRLRQYHGSFSHTARSMGIDPRVFRAARNLKMPKHVALLITSCSRLLALRLLLKELVTAGELKPEAVKKAWAKVRELRP